MKKTTLAWYEFDNPKGAYTLEDGVLWKQEIDADGNFHGDPIKIEDVKGYEHIIADLEWFAR